MAFINQPGVFGTQGVPSINNNPGVSLHNAAMWGDSQGNIWLLGGYGYDSNGNVGYMNSLWEYNVSTNVWTWISGSDTINAIATFGTKGTPNTNNNSGAVFGSSGWFYNGNFWLFGGDSIAAQGHSNTLWRYTI